jgi:hypothetical protein
MHCRLALAAAALAILPATAVETPQWPPPPAVESRMRDLQQVITGRDSTPAEREVAREELSGMLKSPAGQARGRTAGEKPTRPARAAIDPFPTTIVIPPARSMYVAPPPVPASEVARVEVTVPSRPIVDPRSGTAAAPTGRFAIDPRTGNVLHEAGAGFVDPRTGLVVPR